MMVRARLASTFAFALAAAIVVSFAAQEQPSPPRLTPSPVRVDVVVVDRTGHAVPGLRASDFEVFESGARQVIAGVEFHQLGGADPPPLETDEDAARAARQPGTRVFAFFLDELHVSAANADVVRRTVASFIDEKLEPRDLVAVMKPFDAAKSVRFTRDRALAHGVIASFEGRKGDERPRTAQEAQVLQANAAKGGHAQIVKTGLRELVLRLGELNAQRPVLVVFSEGFSADTTAARTPLEDLGGLLRAASRFHVTTFTFNPEPAAVDSRVSREQMTNWQVLRMIAEETGGRAVDANHFGHGVARLFHDPEAYYALTYAPAEPDGRFHPLEVRVKRSGTTVLTHRGRWAMRDNDWAEVLSLPGSAARPTDRWLRRSPLVDVWVGMHHRPDGVTRLMMTWQPRPGAGSAGQIFVKARGADGTPLFDGHVAPVGTPERDASVAEFTVPSGRIELDTAIRDAGGAIFDTDVRHIDVPEFRSSPDGVPLILPAWLVAARTSRGLQRASGEGHLPPAPSRTFYRSQHLLVRVPFFDPSGDGVQVSVALLNKRGVRMRVLEALDPRLADMSDFSLPLAVLAPGKYQLELRAVNRHGAAVERLTFRLVG